MPAAARTDLCLLIAEQAAARHISGKLLTIRIEDINVEKSSEYMGLFHRCHELFDFYGFAVECEQALIARRCMTLVLRKDRDMLLLQFLPDFLHGLVKYLPELRRGFYRARNVQAKR